MKKLIFLISLGTFLFLGLNSCKKDKNDTACSVSWATELQAQSNAMVTAAQTYGANPTVSNCNAYKSAAQAYVNAIKPYGNCATLTGQLRTDWQAAVSSLEASVAEIDCTL